MADARDVPLEDRAILTWSQRKRLDGQAQRALLSASQDLTVCCLASLGRLRQQGDALSRLMAECRRLRIKAAERDETISILRERLKRMEPRRRPHYSPEARFRILEHARKFLLSVEQAAARFLVTPQTLYNWLAELRQHPQRRTLGSLLRPVPPLRRYANVVRSLARQMKAFGFGGNKLIAATLAQVGWKPSPRSIGRFCKEKSRPDTPPVAPRPRTTTVRGRYPNHLWLADITRVPLLFPFLHLHLAVVLDACSRFPLAASVSRFEPAAAAMVALLEEAVARHGKPRHFVSDQGDQFTAAVFREALQALGIRQRFGAVGQHGSIALIERFFRSLKHDLSLRSLRPWSPADFKRRLELALARYAYCRPHLGLAGRVPAERYFGLADQRPFLNFAPRGRPEDAEAAPPFEILFLDPETGTLPILVPRIA